jgi:hypothetical protein
MRRAVVEVKRRERGVGGIEEGEFEGGSGDGGCDGSPEGVFEGGGEVEVGGVVVVFTYSAVPAFPMATGVSRDWSGGGGCRGGG